MVPEHHRNTVRQSRATYFKLRNKSALLFNRSIKSTVNSRRRSYRCAAMQSATKGKTEILRQMVLHHCYQMDAAASRGRFNLISRKMKRIMMKIKHQIPAYIRTRLNNVYTI
ncbi:putative 30S ribosomal protein S20 [Trichinella spiralis]|uniref:putative 30S ribosomal protein S20 n=1 Tax=Trichinella spiralis TaxID=6334 RepID=UPI0001EFB481|nr:putative 30S ribosomal protein S20 [Trichinella spiralis]